MDFSSQNISCGASDIHRANQPSSPRKSKSPKYKVPVIKNVFDISSETIMPTINWSNNQKVPKKKKSSDNLAGSDLGPASVGFQHNR